MHIGYYVVLGFIALLSMVWWSKPAQAPTPTIQDSQFVQAQGDTLTLHVGEEGVTHGIHITLTSVSQDSRCAVDVQCVQAGSITAGVTLKKGAHVEQHTLVSRGGILQFEGYRITIGDVLPQKQSRTSIPQNQYEVTFLVR